MKIRHSLSGLSVREKEGVVDLLVHCVVSILPSLKTVVVNMVDTVRTTSGINMGHVCSIV